MVAIPRKIVEWRAGSRPCNGHRGRATRCPNGEITRGRGLGRAGQRRRAPRGRIRFRAPKDRNNITVGARIGSIQANLYPGEHEHEQFRNHFEISTDIVVRSRSSA